MSSFPSSSVVNSRWVLAHSSFMDSPGRFSGVKRITLSCRLTSDSLQGGSAFGKVCSVSSSIHLLMCVMHVVNFVLRFVQYLLDSMNGGRGVTGIAWILWSGYTQP